MGIIKIQGVCGCCKKPATDFSGKPKPENICYQCISYGGSIGRWCSKYPHKSLNKKSTPKVRKR